MYNDQLRHAKYAVSNGGVFHVCINNDDVAVFHGTTQIF